MCDNFIVALKYIDIITNEQRKEAKKMIRSKFTNLKNNKNFLNGEFYLMLNELHEHSSIETELLRIKKGNSMDTLGINLKLNESKNDLNEWISNYNNKKISIEYQNNRIVNMKLMNK